MTVEMWADVKVVQLVELTVDWTADEMVGVKAD
jgi:hypothetical protein